MKPIALVLAVCLITLSCRDKDTPDPKSGQLPFFNDKLITNDWLVDSVRISRTDTLVNIPFHLKSIFIYAKSSSASVADFSKYQLKLKQGGLFNQIDTDGSESSGIWSLIDGGSTLRLENKDTHLIEHYNISKLDNTTFSFNVVIPDELIYVNLHNRWTSRLGSIYGPLVSARPLVAVIKLNPQ